MSGADGVRYRAFLSYCHRDAAFARRLHRRLEGYAVPRRLVGRVTPRGPVPPRLTPIFRDREELPAAKDLSTEVRAALAASGALIVVCSPGAKASPWVAREIETFRALHPDRPVLAVLAEGEPADAFPATLLGDGVEPLAADFRPGHDGAALGFLKLVSGITGVGLDELIQRDAQRRLRAVTAVTAGAVAVMLAMTGLAVFAFQARSEADRRRADAEGLVEFMLTDLRDKLEGVGRIDVMGAVDARALSHYAAQDIGRLTPDQLDRRSRVLVNMGSDDVEMGDFDRARAQFVEARRMTTLLLRATPKDDERLFTHAQTEYWLAYLDWRAGDLAAAQAGFERYVAMADQLIRLDSKSARWRLEGGYARSNLAVLTLEDRQDSVTAQRLFTEAQRYFAAVARERPGDLDVQRQLADGYAWIAECQRLQGRFQEARANRTAEMAILEALRERDGKNAAYIRDLLGSTLGFAQIDLDVGDYWAVRRRLEPAFAIAAKQSAADPLNTNLAQQRTAIGLTLFRANREIDPSWLGDQNLLDACDAEQVRSDLELQDYCALLKYRWPKSANQRHSTLDYIKKNRDRMANIRRSARWGVNFSRELSKIEIPERK